MRVLPERISAAWIETLTNDDLLELEARQRGKFDVLVKKEKRLRGDKYDMCRGSAELMNAWDRWSRLSAATRERSLIPLKPAVAVE